MKLTIPPFLICLMFGLTMFMVDRFLPVGEFDFFGRKVLILFLSALALLVAATALVQIYRYRTTINPLKPEKTKRLITDGVYDYTRNPMYLCLLMLLIVYGLYLQNAFNTLVAAGFVYFMNYFQIIPEEEVLERKFGKEYRFYLKAVRRWF